MNGVEFIALQGQPTGALCPVCAMEEGTHHWGLCDVCRRVKQRAADAEVARLKRKHPDWYPR
jgi:hypothetical protein